MRPEPNPDNAARREAGERQFVARQRPTNTTCVCCQTFDGQRMSKHCRFDSGLRWDANRKRIITLARKEG